MKNPVVHFEIHGRDSEKTQAFYHALFEWQIDVIPEMNYGLVKAPEDGPGIGGGVVGGVPDTPAFVTFYVAVPDVEAALAKVEELGGKRLFGPMDIPKGPTIGQFTDPDGNMVGVVQEEEG